MISTTLQRFAALTATAAALLAASTAPALAQEPARIAPAAELVAPEKITANTPEEVEVRLTNNGTATIVPTGYFTTEPGSAFELLDWRFNGPDGQPLPRAECRYDADANNGGAEVECVPAEPLRSGETMTIELTVSFPSSDKGKLTLRGRAMPQGLSSGEAEEVDWSQAFDYQDVKIKGGGKQ
jgi:hypothetical protein